MFRIIFPRPGNLVDVGARGTLPHPWGTIFEERLNIVAFEPGGDDVQVPLTPGSLSRIVPKLANSVPGTLPFYLNINPYTSSVFPPNLEEIKAFERQHWEHRQPRKECSFEATTLDEVLGGMEGFNPHFIKIDTQGSEWEILKGAEKELRRGSPLVLVETWTFPVYKGAKPAHAVLELLEGYGYRTIEVNRAAAWRYETNGAVKRARQGLIGLDILLAKRPELTATSDIAEGDLVAIAGLLELYGFRDYAYHLIELSKLASDGKKTLLTSLAANDAWEGTFTGRMRRSNKQRWRSLCRSLGLSPIYPPSLHE
ncbi:MAG: FkbM family methyltransferase [Hymenobacter sp.]|nr:MAG: FkbM family methyltransferase [Hymenobacter sp.]